VRTHLTLGRLLGVPIGINWGVVAVCVLLFWSLANVSLPNVAPAHPSSAYWFAGVVGVIAFMLSLVGHELGHSYVAQRNDVHVVEITLWLFGGVAKLEGEADDPGAEFRIAAAGPLASGVIAVIAGGAAFWLNVSDGNRVLFGLLAWLAAINVVLAVSNLLPAFPLDGGRMLRSFLWRRSRRKAPATRLASMIGQILAVALVVAGLALGFRFSWWTGAWTAALGLFLFAAARAEWSAAQAQPELLSESVATIARQLPEPLHPTASVADLERELTQNPGAPFVPRVDERGEITSVLPREAIRRVPPAHRADVPVRSLDLPLVGLPRVDPNESVADVLARMGQGGQWWAVVVEGGSLTSVVCSEDVETLLEQASV
jgi:Zn-dependent protease